MKGRCPYLKKIYCVEDDLNIRELIEYTLSRTGYDVSCFENAKDFFCAISSELPSLVLLDIMLPDKDGMDILKELRSKSSTRFLPIIMLTAKSSQLDKIKGLDSGADDYITKPFDIMELISRIGALLRRTTFAEGEIIEFGEIILDVSKRSASINNEQIILTFKEFELLKILIINKGTVMTRDFLMNKVWGTDFEGETRTVDVHIRTLRQKLGAYSEYIKTVRNVGYKIG